MEDKDKIYISEKFEMAKPKSLLIIGKEKTVNIGVDIKFNRFQKFMWKKLLNIRIEDIK